MGSITSVSVLIAPFVDECSTCSKQPAPRIRVHIKSPIFIGEVFQFIVSSNAGIQIPSFGVSENQVGPQVSTSASVGPVWDTSFIIVKPVGVFSRSDISFKPESTFNPVNIELEVELSPAMTLTAGYTLKLLFPDFRGSTSFSVAQSYPGGYLCTFHWDSTTFLLTIGKTILPGEQFSLTVPASSGILLPAKGLAANTPTIPLSAISTSAPVLPSPLSSVTGIHALTILSVVYGPPVPLLQSSTTLIFSLSQELLVDETVTLYLPGFAAASEENPLDMHDYFDHIGVWHQGSEQHLQPHEASALGQECVPCQENTKCFASRLQFTVTRIMPAEMAISIQVTKGWLRLPSIE